MKEIVRDTTFQTVPVHAVQIPIDLFVEDAPSHARVEDAQQQELNESVKVEGIHCALEVQPVMDGKQQKWKIVKGARRYRAAKNALMRTVPVCAGRA